MIDFLIIGLPRSGTTWLANLLTTEDSFCLHDPLYKYHYMDIDRVRREKYSNFKTFGISCTGIWRWPEWVEGFSAQKKLIIHRDLSEINKSLDILGLPDCTAEEHESLYKLSGYHVDYDDIFNVDFLSNLCKNLTGSEIKRERIEQILAFNIQPEFAKIDTDNRVIEQLYSELSSL